MTDIVDVERSNRLPELAARISEAHAHVARSMQSGLVNAKIAGELLIEARQSVPHGQWEAWVRAHCRFSARTAQAYMRLARLAPAKAQRVADLSFREATKAIAEKKPLARAAPWRMAEPHDIARFDFERPLHPLCKIFPMMPDDELADLADSIKEGGLLLPITLYKDGSLLDGKLRYIACRMAGVEPRFETLPDDDDPVAAVISRNVMRTGLTPSVQAVWTAAAHLLYPGSRVLPLRMLEMAFDVLQNSPACFEPLRSGALHLTEAHNRMLAERDATAERDHMLTALRVEAPDLAELVTAGQVTLADAVAAADERRERAHRAQLFDASADLLKSLADE